MRPTSNGSGCRTPTASPARSAASSRPESGKVVVLAGAARRLGRTLAARFAAEGATGLTLAGLDDAALDSGLAGFDHVAAKVIAVVTDAAVPANVDRLVDRAIADPGRLDVMVNDAGAMSPNARIHNPPRRGGRRSTSTFQHRSWPARALRLMRPSRSDGTINSASVAGITAWPYGVSKPAVGTS
jgi:NAD(P)-dependent dehydrogenase (short-subunit alcohol dehydrogenase family)